MNTSIFNIMSQIVEYANMTANIAHKKENHEDVQDLLEEKSAKFNAIEKLIINSQSDVKISELNKEINSFIRSV